MLTKKNVGKKKPNKNIAKYTLSLTHPLDETKSIFGYKRQVNE